MLVEWAAIAVIQQNIPQMGLSTLRSQCIDCILSGLVRPLQFEGLLVRGRVAEVAALQCQDLSVQDVEWLVDWWVNAVQTIVLCALGVHCHPVELLVKQIVGSTCERAHQQATAPVDGWKFKLCYH